MMRKSLFVIWIMLWALSCNLFAQERGMSNPKAVFIEKGTKSAGILFGYEHWGADGDEGADLLSIISGLDGYVNNFDISASGSWFVKDNLSLGIALGYADTRAVVDSIDFLGNNESDRHLFRQALSGSVAMRQYLPFFKGNIIAMFVEGRLSARTGYLKSYKMADDRKEGSYSDLGRVMFGFYPGISAFATENISFEVSLALFEFGYNWQNGSGTNSGDSMIDHCFVRLKPSLMALKTGIVYHF